MVGISFVTPFFGATKAKAVGQQLAVRLLIVDITDEHLGIVKHPRYGYGKNMNPCIDCHALMVRVAGRIMEENRWDFIATGEVLGQRPMSQGANSLNAVAKESGYEDFLLRPLSAKLLKPTYPENNGKIDRNKLLGISGRSRKPQLALAQQYRITEYSNPAGGCLLTEVLYCRRLKDLFNQESYSLSDLRLLRYGRHIRLGDKTKIVVGRSQEDNEAIAAIVTKEYITLVASDYPSPLVVVPKSSSADELLLAVRICLAYSDAPAERESEVVVISEGRETRLNATPVDKKSLALIG